MDERLIRSVALFFYLNLLDSKLAFGASQRALMNWRELSRNGKPSYSELISMVHQVLPKAGRFRLENLPQETSWKMSDQVDLAPWIEFQKRSEQKEFWAVLWSQVVGVPEAEIAEAFEVSEGTIRYRINRGLRTLGAVI